MSIITNSILEVVSIVIVMVFCYSLGLATGFSVARRAIVRFLENSYIKENKRVILVMQKPNKSISLFERIRLILKGLN